MKSSFQDPRLEEQMEELRRESRRNEDAHRRRLRGIDSDLDRKRRHANEVYKLELKRIKELIKSDKRAAIAGQKAEQSRRHKLDRATATGNKARLAAATAYTTKQRAIDRKVSSTRDLDGRRQGVSRGLRAGLTIGGAALLTRAIAGAVGRGISNQMELQSRRVSAERQFALAELSGSLDPKAFGLDMRGGKMDMGPEAQAFRMHGAIKRFAAMSGLPFEEAARFYGGIGRTTGGNRAGSTSADNYAELLRAGVGGGSIQQFEALRSRRDIQAEGSPRTIRDIARLASSQKMSGGGIERYLRDIATYTERTAKDGVSLDLSRVAGTLGAMESVYGLSGRGSRNVDILQNLGDVSRGVRNELRSPGAGIARMAMYADLARKTPGDYMGMVSEADEYLRDPMMLSEAINRSFPKGSKARILGQTFAAGQSVEQGRALARGDLNYKQSLPGETKPVPGIRDVVIASRHHEEWAAARIARKQANELLGWDVPAPPSQTTTSVYDRLAPAIQAESDRVADNVMSAEVNKSIQELKYAVDTMWDGLGRWLAEGGAGIIRGLLD